VRDSDGTVVFSIDPVLTGGSKKTVTLAHMVLSTLTSTTAAALLLPQA